jgi:hypothetical protein
MIREEAFGRGSFDQLMMSFDGLTMLSKAEAVSNVEPFSRIGADVQSLETKDTFINRVSSWCEAFI